MGRWRRRCSEAANTIKFFADGVIEAGTGYLFEPYEDAPHSCGLPNWSAEGLAEAVRAFDADGFQIHVHAVEGGESLATLHETEMGAEIIPIGDAPAPGAPAQGGE